MDRGHARLERTLTVFLVCCALAGLAASAWALWSAASSSTSQGAAAAASVNQAATPTTAGAPSQTVTVSWAASTLSNGHAVGGYLVKRYSAGGALQTTLSACAGTISALGCVETNVPDGTWHYTVTPVIATNWQGPASVASTSIIVDTTPPTVSARLSPAANASGWNNSAPVSVSLSASDGTGSGVTQITYTTDGSDPTTSGTKQVYSAAFGVSVNTTVKYYATDNAGNASSVQTQVVEIDSIAPTNGLTLSNQSGGAILAAGTLYYRGSAAGSLTLTNSVADAGGSGAAASATSSLAGTSSGFSHTPSPVTTPAGGPYVSSSFGWSAGTASSPTETVTGSDVAGNATATVVSFVDDGLPASGGSADATGLVGTGSRYAQSQTLQVALAKGTDAGSGLASSGSQLLRAAATLSSGGTSDGTCGSYGSYAQVGANDPSSPVTDAVPSDNACYRYEYTVPDRVGNVATYTSPDIKVETTTPGSLAPGAATLTAVTGTSAQLVSGSSVYYNPAQSGSFTVDSQASDVRSGIAQVAFPSLAGFTGGGSVTAPNTGTTFRTTYSWSANGASASPGAQPVTAANNATATATNASTFSVVKDATAPTGGSVDASGLVGAGGRYSTSTALSIAFAKGTDSGSGLASSGAQLLRASATLSSGGTSDGVCGTYGAYAQVGTNDPTSPKGDAVPSDHTCYRYEYVVADNVGNLATYTSPDIKVDTTAPAAPTLGFSSMTNASASGSAVYYMPGAASGGFTVSGTAGDVFSGITSYALPTLPSGWSSTPGSLGAEVYSYSAANPTAPSGNQNVTATNHAGLTSSATAFTVVGDSTAPSGGTVAYTNGYDTSASVSVSFTAGTDGGSGVNAGSGLLQRASATLAAGACGSYGAFATIASNPTSPDVDTSGTTGNCYEYRYLISDAVGNRATYTSASVVELDTQAPAQAFGVTSPVNASLTGTTLYYNGSLTGSFKFVDTLTDSASGVASATFPSIATTGWTHLTETQNGAGPFTSTTVSWTASPSTPSGYSVSGTDAAGNTAGVGISFTSDTSPPTSGTISYTTAVYNTLSVPITITSATDSGSGIATTVIKRDQAPLTTLTETCGAFAHTFATTVTLVGGDDTSVSSGHCYKYEYVVTDNVGNPATFTSASVATVDTSGPQITAVSALDPLGAAATGLLEVGAKLIFTYNQALATGTVPTSVSNATETRGSSAVFILAPNVLLTIPGLIAGSPDTGTPGYFVGCLALCPARSVTFSGSVALSNAGTGTTVTLTVTSIAGGGDAPFAGSGPATFPPASTITDGGGNAAIGSFTTSGSFKLF
jgi:hypothetical protein